MITLIDSDQHSVAARFHNNEIFSKAKNCPMPLFPSLSRARSLRAQLYTSCSWPASLSTHLKPWILEHFECWPLFKSILRLLSILQNLTNLFKLCINGVNLQVFLESSVYAARKEQRMEQCYIIPAHNENHGQRTLSLNCTLKSGTNAQRECCV